MTHLAVTAVDPAARKAASIAERLARAFLVAFLGQVAASALGVEQVADVGMWKRAAVAGLAAAVSLALSLLGSATGNRSTPSLLPVELDPATPPTGPA